MNGTEIEQAELLDSYWKVLHSEPGIVAPIKLDPGIAALARQLEDEMRPPDPEPAFTARLRHELEGRAAAGARKNRSSEATRQPQPALQPVRLKPALRIWPAVGAAIAAMLAIVALGVALRGGQTQQVSAAEIVKKAQDAAGEVTSGNITSFEMVEQITSSSGGSVATPEQKSVAHTWFRAPNRWRYEIDPENGRASRVTVADGETIWSYDPQQNTVRISQGRLESSAWENYQGNPGAILQDVSNCYQPRLAGDDTVAGRAAYVIDMGATSCPSASMPEMNGPLTLWLDKETYFVLKSTLRDTGNTHTVQTSEVTNIAYDMDIQDSIFTFTLPTGATIADDRPAPTTTAEQFEQRIEELAKQADFPLFVPGVVPDGLVPGQPRLDPAQGLALIYAHAGGTSSGSREESGLIISQQKATYSLVTRWTDQADPVTLESGRAWVRNGVAGTTSSVLVLRDGTLISIASANVPPDELLKVAASLTTVPGSHAPLADIVPTTLSEIRGQVAYPVFVPTYVPDGFVAEAPGGGEQPEDRVEINYHTQDGAKAMLVLNGPQGCCLDAGGNVAGETVDLGNGTTAHYLPGVPESGGPILWWDQEGSYIALSGPNLTKDDLLKIAGSMSKSAGLGLVELPVVPTP